MHVLRVRNAVEKEAIYTGKRDTASEESKAKERESDRLTKKTKKETAPTITDCERTRGTDTARVYSYFQLYTRYSSRVLLGTAHL